MRSADRFSGLRRTVHALAVLGLAICTIGAMFAGAVDLRAQASTGPLGLWVIAQDDAVRTVTINGVDPQRPSRTPFDWNWGDGLITSNWLLQTHTYSGASPGQVFTITVTSHEDDGSTNAAQLPVCFGTGQVSLFTISQDSSTGTVSVNGVDPRRPTRTPFTWIWGDGTTTTGWFPQAHSYTGPAAGYPHSIILRATEDDGSHDCGHVTVFLGGAASQLTITTTTLPPITAGQAYASTIQATGGTPPYTWSRGSGAGPVPPDQLPYLPPAVTFEQTGDVAQIRTDATTRLSTGVYNFTAQVTDSAGTQATAPLRLIVSCGDTRDLIIPQYLQWRIPDPSHANQVFLPACSDFTSAGGGLPYSFFEYNVSNTVARGWALVKWPLLSGLERWVRLIGPRPTLESGYRTPFDQQRLYAFSGMTLGGRHMFGDAADLDVPSKSKEEWTQMIIDAWVAGASWTEPDKPKFQCYQRNNPDGAYRCAHADWRSALPQTYVP